MSDDRIEYYWCMRHARVESGDEVCAGRHRLGPYPTRGEAERALELVGERNEKWETEDERWHGERD